MRKLTSLYLILSLIGILALLFINNFNAQEIKSIIINYSISSISVINSSNSTVIIYCDSCNFEPSIINNNVSAIIREFDGSLFLEKLEVLDD